MSDPGDKLQPNDWNKPPEQRAGTWHHKRGPMTRLIAWLILIMIAGGIVAMVIMIFQR